MVGSLRSKTANGQSNWHAERPPFCPVFTQSPLWAYFPSIPGIKMCSPHKLPEPIWASQFDLQYLQCETAIGALQNLKFLFVLAFRSESSVFNQTKRLSKFQQPFVLFLRSGALAGRRRRHHIFRTNSRRHATSNSVLKSSPFPLLLPSLWRQLFMGLSWRGKIHFPLNRSGDKRLFLNRASFLPGLDFDGTDGS